jgi:hypothetical protein
MLQKRLTMAEIVKLTSSENAKNMSIGVRTTFYNRNRTRALDELLKLVYSGKKWILPPGRPPFTVNSVDDTKFNLYNMSRMFPYFFEGSPVKSSVRREQLFISLLESIDAEDCELLLRLKDGWRPYNVTMAVRLGVADPKQHKAETEAEAETEELSHG